MDGGTIPYIYVVLCNSFQNSNPHSCSKPSGIMQLFNIATALASSAALVLAIPTPPAGSCVVSMIGTPYTLLTLRPTPCNDQPGLATLTNGQFVTNLHKSKTGCGFSYNSVGYTTPKGQYMEGWVGSEYVYCPSSPPASDQYAVSCGNWSVKYGGGSNACDAGSSFTTSSNTTCSTDGSNCQAQCCTPIVLN